MENKSKGENQKLIDIVRRVPKDFGINEEGLPIIVCRVPLEKEKNLKESKTKKNGKEKESYFVDNGYPYTVTKGLIKIVERKKETEMIAPVDFNKFKESLNPYYEVEEYNQHSKKIGLSFSCSRGPDIKGIDKISQQMIGGLFYEANDGLYVCQDKISTPLKLCNFTINIECVVIEKLSENEEEEYIIVRISGNNEKIKVLRSSYENIMDIICKKYPEFYVCAEFRGTHKIYFREYAAKIYSTAKKHLKKKYVYKFHGWHRIDGKMKFLSNNGESCISKCKIPIVQNEKILEVWRRGIYFLQVGNAENLNIMGVNELKMILPFFLYCHLGFAVKLLRDAGLDLQFVLAIIGPSGSLKTAICKAFAEPFNKGGMLNFYSTPRAIELYRKSSIDETMLVDDIFSNRKKVALEKFEGILRAFGDGIGRAKSDATFDNIEQIEVRGGCIITAEHDLGSQQSSALRYVTVNVERNRLNGDVLKEFQRNEVDSEKDGTPSWVQEYFAAWIQYLEQNYEKIVKFIADFQPPKCNFKFKRHQSNYKVFCIVSALILQWGRSIGALTESNKNNIYEKWTQIILEVMMDNQQQASICEPYQQFLQVIQQGIGTGAISIAKNKEDYEKNGNRYIGYKRIEKGEEQYVLAPEKAINFVENWIESLGKELISDASTIYKRLFENKITLGYCNKDGRGSVRKRYLKRIKLNSQQVEMLIIRVKAMNELLEKL